MLRWIIFLGLVLNSTPSLLHAAEPPISISGNQSGNIFTCSQGRLVVTLAADTGTDTGAVEVEDDGGASIAHATCRAGTPLVLPLPAPGFYRIRVVAGNNRATSTALVLDADGASGKPTSTNRWQRTHLDLSQVQTTTTSFTWNAASQAELAWLADAHTSAAPTIVCLGRIPDAWTTKPSPMTPAERDLVYPPRDWQLTAAMLNWVIARLPPAVIAIEAIDRPEVYWRGSDEELVRYQRLVADAAHILRPQLVVLGLGFGEVNQEQLMHLDRLTLFDHLDGLALHPADHDGMPEGDFITRIDTLRNWNAARRRALPIYLTEVDWHPTTLPVGVTDELVQARSRARMQLLLAARPDVVAYHLSAADAAVPASNPGLADAYAAITQRQLNNATHAHLFDLGGDTHALVWTTADRSSNHSSSHSSSHCRLALWTGQTTSVLHLPLPASAAWSACGRKLAPPGTTTLISPDPRYLLLDDSYLSTAMTLPPLVVPAGTTTKLPFSSVLAAATLLEALPPDFACPTGGWRVRADAPRGEWQIIGRTTTGWMVQPLTVAAPVVATGSVVWNQGQPHWRVTLTSRLAQAATVTVTLAIDGDERLRTRTTQVPMGGTASLDLPLADLPWGQRLQGTLGLVVNGAASTWRGQQPITATLAAFVTTRADDPDMAHVPIMDISTWAPFIGGGQTVAAPPPGLRARLRLAYDGTGIHLLADVDDPLHHQEQAPPEMWQQDSLQVAFDVDADQPWQPARRSYWNGHRVVEYHLSLAADGTTRCWRAWAANGLIGRSSEPRVSAHIERTAGTTCYRLLFPWAMLGLDMPLTAGRKLGLAIAVNDVDEVAAKRSGLRLFLGIVEAKDATCFGLLPLLP